MCIIALCSNTAIKKLIALPDSSFTFILLTAATTMFLPNPNMDGLNVKYLFVTEHDNACGGREYQETEDYLLELEA
jgi:hypothetical protein